VTNALEIQGKSARHCRGFVSNDKESTLRLMTSRAGKFGAAFRITWDERAPLAEELMASIDGDADADADDEDDLGLWHAREDVEPRYAGDAADAPVSEDRWDNAQLRLTRSS
jgi:hypothetical protein